MRDGAGPVCDIYRRKEGQVPAILNISSYQKDKVWVRADLEEKANPT